MNLLVKNLTFFFSALLFTSLLLSCKAKDNSMKMNHPKNIHGVRSFRRSFHDLNDKHLSVARHWGVKPINSLKSVEALSDDLVSILDNDHYVVDKLTYSIPYLVPRASNLLSDIGEAFEDSLVNKGLNPYQVIVTSVMRTKENVRKLRRRNINASNNSAHAYGTTFDISWARFHQVLDEDGRPLEKVNNRTLKLVLAEVLRDSKKNKKCYVKYEIKQGCFHITVR